MIFRLIPFILFIFLLGCDNCPTPTKIYSHSGLGLLGAALSAEGDNALISTVDLGVQFWDLQENELKFKFKHQDDQPILGLDIAKETQIGISLSTDSLVVWDLLSGQDYRYLELKDPPTSVKISRTGKFALIGFTSNQAQLIDLTKGQILRRFEHADVVNAVELSPQQDLAIIGSDDTSVRVWNLNSGQMLYQWFHPAKVTHLKTAPNNQYLLNHSAFHKTWIHDLETGQRISELKVHSDSYLKKASPAITSSLFTKDSQTLLTGHPPNRIKIWDVTTGNLKNTVYLPKRSLWKPGASIALAMALNEDESLLTVETSNGQGYQFLMSDLL